MKRLAAIVMALVLSISLVAASPSYEHEFIDRINHERVSRGLNELSSVGSLTDMARRHSQRMADRGDIYHNPNLGSEAGEWEKVGENVARGPGVDSIHNGFMNSSGHRANILDPDWEEIGVGVVVEDDQMWVTEVFRDPVDEGPEPEPEPQPEPDPEPEPEPGPRPEPAPEPAPTLTPPGGEFVYTKLYYMLKKIERLESSTGVG